MKQQRVLSILAFAALLASALGPTACTSDAGILVIEPPDIDTTVQVLFSEDIIPLFNQSCNFSGCHNTGGIAPDLSQDNAYASLQDGAYINTETPGDSELMQWLLGNGGRKVMPINGKNDEIISKVLTWITQGAKDN